MDDIELSMMITHLETVSGSTCTLLIFTLQPRLKYRNCVWQHMHLVDIQSAAQTYIEINVVVMFVIYSQGLDAMSDNTYFVDRQPVP